MNTFLLIGFILLKVLPPLINDGLDLLVDSPCIFRLLFDHWLRPTQMAHDFAFLEQACPLLSGSTYRSEPEASRPLARPGSSAQHSHRKGTNLF